MGKKFIDKKKATTYNLVYRSQEDPLAFEEGGSERVFIEANGRRGNRDHGKGKEADQTVEQSLRDMQLDGMDDEDPDLDQEQQAGKAALYGIYLDDRDYDYTKHLRSVGTGGGVLLDVPQKKKPKTSGIQILDKEDEEISASGQSSKRAVLPAEVLPSQHRMDIKTEGIPLGLQLDMDEDVRETMMALEDDDLEEFEDDLLDKLNADTPPEGEEYEEYEGDGDDDGDEDFDPEDVFAHIRRLKERKMLRKSGAAGYGSESDYSGSDNDDNDDAHQRWRSSRTESTGFSMSSSAMYRNENLSLLDKQFDALEAMYEHEDTDSEDERYDENGRYIPEYDEDGNAKPISTRTDFENVMDDFLQSYELTGKKMQQVLEGSTGTDKLDTTRDALLDEDKTREESKKELLKTGMRIIEESNARTRKQDDEELNEMLKANEKKRTPWDCQTILTTYSTLDNHPSTIYEERAPKINISRKTGFPLVQEGDEQPTEEEGEKENKGKARSKGETKEEKWARKKQLQEEKRNRREAKKESRDEYADKLNRKLQSRNDRAQFVVHFD